MADLTQKTLDRLDSLGFKKTREPRYARVSDDLFFHVQFSGGRDLRIWHSIYPITYPFINIQQAGLGGWMPDEERVLIPAEEVEDRFPMAMEKLVLNQLTRVSKSIQSIEDYLRIAESSPYPRCQSIKPYCYIMMNDIDKAMQIFLEIKNYWEEKDLTESNPNYDEAERFVSLQGSAAEIRQACNDKLEEYRIANISRLKLSKFFPKEQLSNSPQVQAKGKRRSSDPLTAACTSFLTPWARKNGFKKVSNRMYARDSGDTVQRLMVDANGVGGQKSTLFILSSHLVYEEITGYWDKAGFRLCGDKRWDMSSHGIADESMQDVVKVLDESELAKIDAISTAEGYFDLFSRFMPEHLEEKSRMLKAWRSGDKALAKISETNRKKLKLI